MIAASLVMKRTDVGILKDTQSTRIRARFNRLKEKSQVLQIPELLKLIVFHELTQLKHIHVLV